jgi:hypothetical protein
MTRARSAGERVRRYPTSSSARSSRAGVPVAAGPDVGGRMVFELCINMIIWWRTSESSPLCRQPGRAHA